MFMIFLNNFYSIVNAGLQLFCFLHTNFLEISNSAFYTSIQTSFWFQLNFRRISRLQQALPKGAVIIYGQGGGRRENGWVKEKFEVL